MSEVVEHLQALGASDAAVAFAARTLPGAMREAFEAIGWFGYDRVTCAPADPGPSQAEQLANEAMLDALRCSGYTAPEVVTARMRRLDAAIAAIESAPAEART